MKEGVIKERENEESSPDIPIDFNLAFKKGRVRRSTGIVSTICDDRGEEVDYLIKFFFSEGQNLLFLFFIFFFYF